MVPAGINHCVMLKLGGIDSSATVVACQELGAALMAMFMDYWQPAAWSEEEAQRVAIYYCYKGTSEVEYEGFTSRGSIKPMVDEIDRVSGKPWKTRHEPSRRHECVC